ncbi:MerR family DNA-binding protein [Streptomyces sp. NPDC000880]
MSRTGFYPRESSDGTERPGPYQHLAKGFTHRLAAQQQAGTIADPRAAQVERLKVQVAALRERLVAALRERLKERDQEVRELTEFRTQALSRLAAQRAEIERLRQQAAPAPLRARLYGEEAVTALRVIKAAQRLGFTLEEVAERREAGRHRHGRPVAGLQERAQAKLPEVDAKFADLTTIRTAPAAAVDAGCDDLTVCASIACCLISFTDLAEENRHAGPCC